MRFSEIIPLFSFYDSTKSDLPKKLKTWEKTTFTREIKELKSSIKVINITHPFKEGAVEKSGEELKKYINAFEVYKENYEFFEKRT